MKHFTVTSWSAVWCGGVVTLFNLEGIRHSEKCEDNGDIAQLGERLPCKQEVAGSIPTISTRKTGP